MSAAAAAALSCIACTGLIIGISIPYMVYEEITITRGDDTVKGHYNVGLWSYGYELKGGGIDETKTHTYDCGNYYYYTYEVDSETGQVTTHPSDEDCTTGRSLYVTATVLSGITFTWTVHAMFNSTPDQLQCAAVGNIVAMIFDMVAGWFLNDSFASRPSRIGLPTPLSGSSVNLNPWWHFSYIMLWLAMSLHFVVAILCFIDYRAETYVPDKPKHGEHQPISTKDTASHRACESTPMSTPDITAKV